MSCERWNDAILGMLYEEIETGERREIEAHLEGCASCRGTLGELTRVRTLLRDNEPDVPKMPRVVVLREPARFRPALLAASLLSAALLAGAGAGAGYAIGKSRAPVPSPVDVATVPVEPAGLDAAAEARMKALETRLAAYETAGRPEEAPSAALTEHDLQAALTKFERKLNSVRASDMEYLMGEMQAAEVRNTARLGQTNQALRYVALASNPNVSER